MLRVPVKPRVLSGLPQLNEIIVSSYDMNEDMILAYPDKPTSITILEKVKRDDQIRDWVLYQFSEYLKKDVKLNEMCKGSLTKEVKDRISVWVYENLSPKISNEPSIYRSS